MKTLPSKMTLSGLPCIASFVFFRQCVDVLRLLKARVPAVIVLKHATPEFVVLDVETLRGLEALHGPIDWAACKTAGKNADKSNHEAEVLST